MSKESRKYTYSKSYDSVVDENGKITVSSKNSCLDVWHGDRKYHTKLNVEDLPEHFCDVQRWGSNRDVMSTKGVTDIFYTWVKENHFMKDSVLHVSYSGKLEPYNDIYTINGEEVVSRFISYKNDDGMVFGHSIFKFLHYVHKYSDISIDHVRNEFIKQCEWLAKNEPEFAPELEDGQTYGQWFDKKIIDFKDYDY